MSIKTIGEIMAEHPFFEGFAPEHVELVAGCSKNVRFDAGEFLMREGDPADHFFLVRHGKVALEITSPGRPPVIVTTLQDGDIVGASWLTPPYLAMFDARALELTRAVQIDAKCLRGKCDADHSLGYDMMQGVLRVLVKRLQATRLQILDVYGER